MAKDNFQNQRLPSDQTVTRAEVVDLIQQQIADFAGTSTYRKGVTTGITVSGITFTALATGWKGEGGTASRTMEVTGNAQVSGNNTGDQDLSPYLLKAGGTMTGNLAMDTKNITTDTTTGTKFGASDTAKISLYNATPIVRQNHIADPSGGATVDAEARSAINAILVALENMGITKTS